MIIFKKIRWKNFISSGDKFIEIELNKHPKTFLSGVNGSGKSTLLDALTFGLFGKPYRNINKNGLINSVNKRNTEVQIEFNIGNNEYKIIRGLAPNKFTIITNGNEPSQDCSIKDQQKDFETNVLNMNYKTFVQVVVLGISSFLPFMQLPTQQRRELIENLLDISVFSSMNQILKIKILENNQKISSLESNNTILDEKISSQKRVINLIKNNKKKSKSDIDNKIDILKSELTSLDKRLHVTYNNIEFTINSKNPEIIEIKKSCKRYESVIYKLEYKLKVLEKEKIFLKENYICATCKQEIDDKYRMRRMGEINGEISKLSSGIFEAKRSLSEIKNTLSAEEIINNKISNLRSEASKIVDQKKYILKDIEKNETEFIKKDNSDIIKEEIKFNEFLAERILLNKYYKDAVINREIYNSTLELLKDSGIKSNIVNKYLPKINVLINKYLADMDFFVDFHLDESFKEIIKSRYRDEFHYQNFSEGEKLRIDLCLLFAWRMIAKLKNSINTNILILDEIFDSSLDANGTDEFVKILNDVCKDMNVFVISHKVDILSEKFDNNIQFNKNKGFSEIV